MNMPMCLILPYHTVLDPGQYNKWLVQVQTGIWGENLVQGDKGHELRYNFYQNK